MNAYSSYALPLFLAVFVAPAVAAETQAESEAVAPTGVIQLFNGRDFTGLYTFLKGRGVGEKPDEVFRIEDGAIRGSGKGADLVTQSQFGDFELKFEWKISPGGNSGRM